MSTPRDNDWKWSAEQSDYYRYTYNRDGTWGRVEWGRSRLPDPDSPPPPHSQPQPQPPPPQPHVYPQYGTANTTNLPHQPQSQVQTLPSTRSGQSHVPQAPYAQPGTQYSYSYGQTVPTQTPPQLSTYSTGQEGVNTYGSTDAPAPRTTQNDNPQNSTYSQNPNPYRQQDPWPPTRRTGP